MKNLILIGAGAFGREIAAWLPACVGYGIDFKFKGFIDSKLDRLDGYDCAGKIIELIEMYQPEKDDVFLCTVADQRYRERYAHKMQERGGQFISVIHSSSVVDQQSTIGVGCFVAPFCTISCDVTIGNHVLLNSYAAVGHDVRVGDHCHINSFTLLGGHSVLGKNVTVHPNCTILPGKVVGHDATVGAGSVVLHRVAPNSTVFGSPAKKIF